MRKGGGRAIQQHDEEVHRLNAIEYALRQRQRQRINRTQKVKEMDDLPHTTRNLSKVDEGICDDRRKLRELLLDVPFEEQGDVFVKESQAGTGIIKAYTSMFQTLMSDLNTFYLSNQANAGNNEVCSSITSNGTSRTYFGINPTASISSGTTDGRLSSSENVDSSISSNSAASSPCESSSSGESDEDVEKTGIDSASKCSSASSKSSLSRRTFGSDGIYRSRSQITARLNAVNQSNPISFQDTMAAFVTTIGQVASIDNNRFIRDCNNGVIYLTSVLSNPGIGNALILLSTDGKTMLFRNASFTRLFEKTENVYNVSVPSAYKYMIDSMILSMSKSLKNRSMTFVEVVQALSSRSHLLDIDMRKFHTRAAFVVDTKEKFRSVTNADRESKTAGDVSRNDDFYGVLLEFELATDHECNSPMYTIG